MALSVGDLGKAKNVLRLSHLYLGREFNFALKGRMIFHWIQGETEMQVYIQSKFVTIGAIPDTTNQGTFDSNILTISKVTGLYW